jgi:Ca2+-binding RTX toxin-like protein
MTTISTPLSATSFSYTVATFSSFFVTRTGSLSASDFISIQSDFGAERVTISIQGDLAAETSLFLRVHSLSSILIGTGATLVNGLGGATMLGSGTFDSGNNTIINNGTVLAAGTLVGMAGGNSTFVNTGTMVGGEGGVLAGLFGPGDRVANHGSITVTGARAGAPNSGYGVLFDASGHHLNNTGRIETFVTGKAGVIVNQANGTGTIVNTGLIFALDGPAVAANEAAGTIRVDNSGTLHSEGGGVAVLLGAGGDTVVNTGRILGNVETRDGSDLIDLRAGSVAGVVMGGAGDDLYRVATPGVALVELGAQSTDTVEAWVDWALAPEFEVLRLEGGARLGIGNDGNNILIGALGPSRLFGLGGDDALVGITGSDQFDGGAGNDTLQGNEGDDTLYGRAGNDSLEGGQGDDWLMAGLGNDQLLGGEGEDVLSGGRGRDTLTGGAESDRFVFLAAAETPTGAGRDVITDFEKGLDRIDLSRIDARLTNGVADDAFTFIGTAAFTAGTQGQLRFSQAGGVTVIAFDLDGNGVANGEIALTGLITVTAGDFLL